MSSSISTRLNRLRVPVFQAPMFLQSGPEMVIASCRAGIVGSFPSVNARSVDDLERWLQQISASVGDEQAPWAMNLMMHRSNTRRNEDLALAERYRAPIVITALGSDGNLRYRAWIEANPIWNVAWPCSISRRAQASRPMATPCALSPPILSGASSST